jgi:hypothetical protein
MGTKFGGTEWKLRGHFVGEREVQSKLDTDKRTGDKKIANTFTSFIDNLGPKEKRNAEINHKRMFIVRTLSKELSIREAHIIGSYARDTLIEGPEGIDIMFTLDKNQHGDWLRQINGPSDCLRYIREKLLKRPEFHDADIDTDHNSVIVGYGEFKFNIVPAFKSERGYSIPSPTGRQHWISTDPRVFNKIMGHLDKRFKGRMNEIIKIVKGWNDANGKLLRSFHIENMVYEHFKDRPSNIISSLQEDLLNFYARLPTYIQNPTIEPVHRERIDAYLDHDRSEAIDRAQRTVDNLIRAEDQKRRGRYERALEYYKKVFGTKFPH